MIQSQQFPLHKLTQQHTHQMLTYQTHPHLHIQPISEHSHQAFSPNPHFHQYHYLIH
ncbi:anti-sigma-F factor Fin [Siminovitchia fortis]|uniref:anti-sigma-F factor Fin n=1 Tax=Siminovitchia fortis TaxID=254758 RepID=UPI0028CBBC75|nr:anti-sigma-F factor Fin [Siminovitchia fortis]